MPFILKKTSDLSSVGLKSLVFLFAGRVARSCASDRRRDKWSAWIQWTCGPPDRLIKYVRERGNKWMHPSHPSHITTAEIIQNRWTYWSITSIGSKSNGRSKSKPSSLQDNNESQPHDDDRTIIESLRWFVKKRTIVTVHHDQLHQIGRLTIIFVL